MHAEHCYLSLRLGSFLTSAQDSAAYAGRPSHISGVLSLYSPLLSGTLSCELSLPRSPRALHLNTGVSQYLPWVSPLCVMTGNLPTAVSRHTCRAYLLGSRSSAITGLCYLMLIVSEAVVLNILPGFLLGDSVSLAFVSSSWLETEAPQCFFLSDRTTR